MNRVAPLLCLFLITGAPAPAAAPDWITATLAALDAHVAAHPAAQAQDVFKLLHQATMGPGHAVDDPVAAHRWLVREIASLEPSDHTDPLCEPIGGDPEMVRIHLRPFVALGLDAADLTDAFVDSAARGRADPPRLETALAAAVGRLRDTHSVDLATGLDTLRARLSVGDFRTVHHSQAFREAYAPAYRVVMRALADAAGWCDDLRTIDDTEPPDADVEADADAGPRPGS